MNELLLTISNDKVQGIENDFLGSYELEIYENEIVSFIGPNITNAENFLHEVAAIYYGESTLKIDSEIEQPMIAMLAKRSSDIDHLSVFDVLCLTMKFVGIRSQTHLGEAIEKSLRLVHFWRDNKSSLHTPLRELSVLDRAKVHLARTVMFQPDVILMDDPTHDLGPTDTIDFEACIERLKRKAAMVMITTDIEQSARISDKVGVFKQGRLLEYGLASKIFTTPEKKQTEWFITRRDYE